MVAAAAVAASVLSACSRVEDRRSGSGICELHKTNMQTVVVYPSSKLIHFTPDYMRAQPRLFPNTGIAYGPLDYDHEGRPFKIHVCAACVRARDEYTQKHVSR